MYRLNNKIAEIKDIEISSDSLKYKINIEPDWYDFTSEIIFFEFDLPLNDETLQYKVGDLIKFVGEGKFLKVPTENMSYDEYLVLKKRMSNMTCEELIKTHKSLAGKTFIIENNDRLDYQEYFMMDIIDFDFSISRPINVSEEIKKFINSEYVSDYFKQLIKSKFKGENLSLIVLNAINSKRKFASFNEKELDAIYKVLQGLRKTNGKIDPLCNLVFGYTFKLDSKSAVDFLNNKVSPVSVLKRILNTSGLCEKSEYYAEHGVKATDLSGEKLFKIYMHLLKLGEKKALSMMKMTLEMETLPTIDFINALYRLAWNEYVIKQVPNVNNNDIKGGTIWRSISDFNEDETIEIKKEFYRLLQKNSELELREYFNIPYADGVYKRRRM